MTICPICNEDIVYCNCLRNNVIMRGPYDPSRFDTVPVAEKQFTDTEILNFIEANYDLRGGDGRSLREIVSDQIRKATP